MSKANLPDYVTIDQAIRNGTEEQTILRKKAELFIFPLSEEDKKIINILEAKFDNAKALGLAAPQLGFNKAVTVFKVEYSEINKKRRPDLTDSIEKTVWLNPSYKAISDNKTFDWEGCFSVEDRVGFIQRYIDIEYQAFDIDGNLIKGQANGFLARVIQHEIDHLNGILCIDRATDIISMSEYKEVMDARITNCEVALVADTHNLDN